MCVSHSTAAPVVTDSTLNHQNGAKGELEEEHIIKNDPAVPEDNVRGCELRQLLLLFLCIISSLGLVDVLWSLSKGVCRPFQQEDPSV